MENTNPKAYLLQESWTATNPPYATDCYILGIYATPSHAMSAFRERISSLGDCGYISLQEPPTYYHKPNVYSLLKHPDIAAIAYLSITELEMNAPIEHNRPKL